MCGLRKSQIGILIIIAGSKFEYSENFKALMHESRLVTRGYELIYCYSILTTWDNGSWWLNQWRRLSITSNPLPTTAQITPLLTVIIQDDDLSHPQSQLYKVAEFTRHLNYHDEALIKLDSLIITDRDRYWLRIIARWKGDASSDRIVVFGCYTWMIIQTTELALQELILILYTCRTNSHTWSQILGQHEYWGLNFHSHTLVIYTHLHHTASTYLLLFHPLWISWVSLQTLLLVAQLAPRPLQHFLSPGNVTR